MTEIKEYIERLRDLLCSWIQRHENINATDPKAEDLTFLI